MKHSSLSTSEDKDHPKQQHQVGTAQGYDNCVSERVHGERSVGYN